MLRKNGESMVRLFVPLCGNLLSKIPCQSCVNPCQKISASFAVLAVKIARLRQDYAAVFATLRVNGAWNRAYKLKKEYNKV